MTAVLLVQPLLLVPFHLRLHLLKCCFRQHSHRSPAFQTKSKHLETRDHISPPPCGSVICGRTVFRTHWGAVEEQGLLGDEQRVGEGRRSPRPTGSCRVPPTEPTSQNQTLHNHGRAGPLLASCPQHNPAARWYPFASSSGHLEKHGCSCPKGLK